MLIVFIRIFKIFWLLQQILIQTGFVFRAMHLEKRVGKESAVFQATTRQLTWTPRRGSSCAPSSIWPSRSSTSRRWTRRCRRDVRAIWFRLPKATLNRVAPNCVICVKQLRSMPLTTVPPVSFYLRQNCPRPMCSLTTTKITHNTTPRLAFLFWLPQNGTNAHVDEQPKYYWSLCWVIIELQIWCIG